MAAIPFENLDVLLGRGVRVDLESVTAKLVTARRGGYCFEHGTLFQAALRALGVEATAHAARVLLVAPKAEAPRTHMFLTVVDGGTTWVLDPGLRRSGAARAGAARRRAGGAPRPRRPPARAPRRRMGARGAGERRHDGAVDLVARAAVPGGLRAGQPLRVHVSRLAVRDPAHDSRADAGGSRVGHEPRRHRAAATAWPRSTSSPTAPRCGGWSPGISGSTCRRSTGCVCRPCPSGPEAAAPAWPPSPPLRPFISCASTASRSPSTRIATRSTAARACRRASSAWTSTRSSRRWSCRTNAKQPLLVLMHGDREVSTKQLARQIDRKTVEPCDAAVAQKHTGYAVGGTSPFGTRKPLPVYVERTVLELDRIYINGGASRPARLHCAGRTDPCAETPSAVEAATFSPERPKCRARQPSARGLAGRDGGARQRVVVPGRNPQADCRLRLPHGSRRARAQPLRDEVRE